MMALPAWIEISLSISARSDEFRRAAIWLQSVCAKSGVPAESVLGLDVCLEETVANIIGHGGDSALATSIDRSDSDAASSVGEQWLRTIDGQRGGYRV